MKLNTEGLALIKKFEGCKLKAYKCAAGVWTIGYGHTKDVKEGDIITKVQAEDFLSQDLEAFEKGLRRMLIVQLNTNQFSALISFAFNVGLGNLQRSTLLRKVNTKASDAAEAFLPWNKAGGKVLKGLTERRKAERELYLTEYPEEGDLIIG